MSEYRWANAHEWLRNYVDRTPVDTDRSDFWRNLVMSLASKLDSDEIQDEFEREMDADGYFEKIE